MKPKHKSLALLLLCSLAVGNAFAKSDFDNSDVPPNVKGYSFKGGCGSVVKFEAVDNVQPRYSDRRPDQNKVHTGGLLGAALSMIPGVGFVAAVVADATTSIVGSAVSSAAANDKDETAVKEKKWDKVYWLTVKPDFGPEFTIPYEKLNQRTPEIGSRVQMGSDAFVPDRKLNIFFAGNKDFGDVLSEEYVEFCYGGTHTSFPDNVKVRQLAYNGTEFEWKRVDPKIQSAVDVFYTKNKAKSESSKAEASEAASYDHR